MATSPRRQSRLQLLTEALLLTVSGLMAAQSVAGAAAEGAAVPGAALAAPFAEDDAEGGPMLDSEGVLAAVPGQRLLLMLWLNGMDRGVIEVRRDGERFWTSADVLRRAGLRLPDDAYGPIEINRLPGVALRYDAPGQLLELMVPPELFGTPATLVNDIDAEFASADTAPGAALNYDVYGGFNGRSADLSSLLEFRAFAGNDVLDSTGLVQWSSAGPGSRSRATRLDTSWSRAWPEKRLRLVVGDTITSAMSWSRATRFGGVQLGTDFSLQPYFPTVPIPEYFGSAVLPSQIELYVNGVRRYSGEVPAGPFELTTGPVRIDGAGQAEVVLTDALGRVTSQSFAIYETPELLRRGLTEWSAEAGAVRLDYGLDSFSYADEVAFSGSWRRGITDGLTLEAHAEATPHLALGGVGATVLLGQLGVVTGSFSASDGRRGSGTQWSAGYSWSNGSVYFSAEMQRASRDFADLATRWDGPPPRERDQLQAGISSRRLGALGLNYARLRPAVGRAYRYAGVNWSRPLGRRLSLHASAEQNLDERSDRRFLVSLSFTPGSGYYASAGWENYRGRDGADLTVQRTAPLSGGLGWRADARHDFESDDLDGQAQVSWLGPYGEARAGAAHFAGRESAFAGYSGALVLIGGGLYASRRIDDGFALVDTAGIADVPVTVENNVVGRTDREGRLLVTRLNAYQRNAIGIDPSDLPETLVIEDVVVQAVPGSRAGVIVEFPLYEVSAVLLTVTDADGVPLPAGSMVRVEGRAEPLVVGFDGQLYVENPPPGALLTIESAQGVCALRLPEQIASGSVARLGAMRCEARP